MNLFCCCSGWEGLLGMELMVAVEKLPPNRSRDRLVLGVRTSLCPKSCNGGINLC